MNYPAYYMDGESAIRHPVSLVFEGKHIVIRSVEGEYLASWEMGKIYPVDKLGEEEALLLACSTSGNARLKIEDRDTRVWLFNILPGLMRRTDHRKETRLAWKLTAGLVVCAALVYFSIPYLARVVVAMVPLEWEQDMFEGSSIEIARTLGASKKCTSPSGERVLKQVLARLVGEDKAAQIKLSVVRHDMVNAFATPGNEIILMSGLIKKADNGGEVVGVLAHELGHVEKRHALQGMVRGAGLTFLLATISGGSITDIAGLLAETAYSRDHERAADQYALRTLKKAGLKADGLADFFDKLDKENRSLETYLRFVSTHPMSKERAERIRAQKGGGPALSPGDWQALKDICLMLEPL